MWLESRPAGWSEAASKPSGSPHTRGSCSSRSSIEPTSTRGSRGRLSCYWSEISALPDRRSKGRSHVSSRSGRSPSTNRVGPVGRPGIACATSPSNLPGRRAGSLHETCPFHGAGRKGPTCPPAGQEVKTPHAGRSAAAVRALPGAGRSLRSLRVMILNGSRAAGRRGGWQFSRRLGVRTSLWVGGRCCAASRRRSPWSGSGRDGGTVSRVTEPRMKWRRTRRPRYARGVAGR